MEYMNRPIGVKKTIALIAHDNRKKDMLAWVKQNYQSLRMHTLCGTGTTAKLVESETGLPVHPYNSGPLGGDQQIGAKIVEGDINMLIFFWDPLSAQPHDPDVKALLRIAVLYDIPVASNQATADFLINSKFMDQEYEHMQIEVSYSKQVEDKTMKIRKISMKEG